MAVTRKLATKPELEAMIVHKVRRTQRLTGVEMIAVIGPVERPDCNWQVAIYPATAAKLVELKKIIDRFQRNYVLKV